MPLGVNSFTTCKAENAGKRVVKVNLIGTSKGLTYNNPRLYSSL